jgi:glucans biosynthesis protein
MRLHLVLGLITALLLVWTLRYQETHKFNFTKIQEEAATLAQQPFVPLTYDLPLQLKKLTPDQERGIFWNDKYRLWKKKGLPFQIDFFPLSVEFPNAIKVNTVDYRGEHSLSSLTSFFNVNIPVNPPLPEELGYAGFYVRYPINKSDSLDGFFSVQGASYFRAIAKDQVYGLSARALGINTGVDGKPEEFPQFKEWWLHEPAPGDTSLVLDALLDSPSVTGAYGFKIKPGASTSVDVHATLFFRKTVDWIAIAPFSSMYLYGENASNHFNDKIHPEIHDSDGVLLNTSKGDWIWRPLSQATLFQIYNFADENPKGFGLLQRDRDGTHYQDLNMQYNIRPSVWVTPKGNWGKGSVVLAHRPSNDVNNDNVALFWHPAQTPKAGERMDIDYTITFYMNDAQLPPLAYSRETWLINNPPPPAPPQPALPPGQKPPPALPAPPAPKPGDTTPVMFITDFVGNGIENIPANQPPYLYLHCDPPETKIRESSVEKVGYDNSWRATFTIIPFKHNVPTEIHCRLMKSDKPDAQPLTEEWTYTWHQ